MEFVFGESELVRGVSKEERLEIEKRDKQVSLSRVVFVKRVEREISAFLGKPYKYQKY